ncbi:MAG: IucA/IucC family protein, partial [Frankia sp.]
MRLARDTAMRIPVAEPDLPGEPEQALVTRVVDALYREDHLGLASRARPAGPPGVPPADVPLVGAVRAMWWASPLDGNRRVLAPMRSDGFLADRRLAAPFLVLEEKGRPPTLAARLDDVLAALAPAGDPERVAGWLAFADECRQALAVARLPIPALALPADGTGYQGLARYEAIAASREHPVHPLGRCRIGVPASELRGYAPEFSPRFRLRWCAVPAGALTRAGALPAWWPGPSALGLPARLDGDHVALPVHPVTAARGLVAVGARPSVVVTPTLSTRTVAVVADPAVALKLPLPTATLGARNRRTIAPGTLADGATMHRLLGAVLDREPALRPRVLLADESTWIETGDENLAVLVRRLPPGLEGCTLVPVAALAARTPGPGRPGDTVLADLGSRYSGGLTALLVDYLDTLFDWHVGLWLRYGVALEAHGQNVTLVLDPPASGLPAAGDPPAGAPVALQGQRRWEDRP